MYCGNCGKPIDKEQNYCSYCGKMQKSLAENSYSPHTEQSPPLPPMMIL
ncbi:zinc ribbon domain-containing protein [Avibacterium paragallinarum]